MYFQYGEKELNYLKSRDKKLAAAIEAIGPIKRRVDDDVFSSVVHHIIGQQISTAAQATLWQRLSAKLGTIDSESILSLSREELQSIGMTYKKADYIQDFAAKVHSGAFDIRALESMTDEEMWKAVLHNDASYDGVFFYGVKTTGIYCRPSCKSKAPKRENVCFFATSEEARKAGFRPCKRCRSDLLDYEPMKQLAEDVKQKIEAFYREQSALYHELGEVGVTGRRLTDVFRDVYGMTPKAYMDKLRLQEAKHLLPATDKKIIDIAYAVGFGSLSAFYRFFQKELSLTPSAYRRQSQKEKCEPK